MPTDPLCPFILHQNWRGILIEPVPKIFEKLKKNYAGYPHLHFENVAISDTRKTCEFYVVDENSDYLKNNPQLKNECGGPYGDLVGSLDKNHVLRCKPDLTEKDIKVLQVPCVTLQDIVDKYHLDRIDVLHIDAEGHDEKILLSIDYNRISPQFIIFEHSAMPFDRYLFLLDYLSSHGYSRVDSTHLDTMVRKLADMKLSD